MTQMVHELLTISHKHQPIAPTEVRTYESQNQNMT